MKLTNPESIQESEKEFIDTINAELDWDAIEQMLLEKHGFAVQEEVNYRDGNLIVYNDQIAYKFEFEIKVPLSVIFNREGECLKISTRDESLGDEEETFEGEVSEGEEPEDIEPEEAVADSPAKPSRDLEKIRGAASEIADMISEINEQGD